MKSTLLLAMTLPLFAQKPLIEGNPASPVRVVIYEDLQCSDCAAFRQMLDEKLLPAYGARVAFEHRDFPLVKHAWARPAAVVSRYLQSLGEPLAVRFRQEAMKAQREIRAGSFDAWLKGFCERNKLDQAKVEAAQSDPALQALVQQDCDEGVSRGIARTPTALVNGEPYIETFTFEEIAKGIEAALKEN